MHDDAIVRAGREYLAQQERERIRQAEHEAKAREGAAAQAAARLEAANTDRNTLAFIERYVKWLLDHEIAPPESLGGFFRRGWPVAYVVFGGTFAGEVSYGSSSTLFVTKGHEIYRWFDGNYIGGSTKAKWVRYNEIPSMSAVVRGIGQYLAKIGMLDQWQRDN